MNSLYSTEANYIASEIQFNKNKKYCQYKQG
jgi:hypothetical protein